MVNLERMTASHGKSRRLGTKKALGGNRLLSGGDEFNIREVKHSGNCRGYIGTYSLKNLGENSIRTNIREGLRQIGLSLIRKVFTS